MSRTQRARPRRNPLRAVALAIAAALVASAALLVGSEAPVQAATPLTLATMTIDGSFGDWGSVLANVNQATRDGDGSSYTQEQCAQFSGDRDCTLAGGSGNDFLTFAWTYDEANVYLYVERYGSPTNGVDLLFVADVNGDKLLTSGDRVVHAHWNGTNGTVSLDWSPYAPANAAGDSIVCAPLAPATMCANAAGVLAAPAGYVDGYKLPGANPSAFTCAGCVGRGNTTAADPLKGLQVEVAIPWSTFGVAAPRPFYWHTVSSNNKSLAGAVDNIGAPDGRLGSFFYRAVSLTPDRSGVVTSPGAVEYAHLLANGGNAQDTFDFVATSTAGAGVELLLGGVVVGRDDEGDGTWEYASDSNANGLPDVTLGVAGSTALTVRIVMPAERRGEDVTRVTARSAGDLLVSATVTDTTVVGSPALLPPEQSMGTMAGQAAPFALTLVNSEPVADTFEFTVDAGCPGRLVQLRADGAGAPGALLASDDDGDGAWDSVPGDTNADGNPDFADVAADGTRVPLWLEITPPAGAASGERCTVRLTARSAATGATDYAEQTVTVGPAVSFTPSYTFAAGTNRVVAPGGRVYFPGVIENNEPVARAYALSVGARVPAAIATPIVWTDPDGDGNPSDGAVVTTTGMVPAYGGRTAVVVELVAETSSGADLAVGTAVTVPVIATPTAGGAAAATQLDEARVGYLSTFGDALLTNAARAFAPCDTVIARASSLALSNVTRYSLEWRDPAGAALRTVAPWATTSRGTAEDSLPLPAGAAPGTWTLVLKDGAATLEALTFEVERSGVFVTLATDRARAAPGMPLAVNATVRSTQQTAPLSGTALRYVVEDVGQTVYMDLAGAFRAGAGSTRTAPLGVLSPGATRSDGFSVAAVSYPAPGAYQVRAEWQLACGGDPLVASAVSSFEVPPSPPVITFPSSGALVGTRRPTVTGTAHPGATVTLHEGAATFGPVLASPTGTFEHPLSAAEALADGPHAFTAIQSFGGVASEASAAVSFTVDATAPEAPVLAPISTPTRAEPIAVSGAAEADGLVTLVLDGVVAGTVTASPTGTFSTTLAGVGELPAPHALHATVRDAAGNVSPASATVTFTVDRTPPEAPIFDPIASPTSASPVPVSGTAEADATVSLVLDGAPAATVTATGGVFAAALAVGELPAPHALAATATDAAGNESEPSTTSFVVDRTLPDSPVLDPVDSPTNDDPVVLTGTAEPAADVLVSVDGAVVATVAADPTTGAFSAPLGALPDGTRFVSAEARDAAGNVGPPSLTLSFVVDRTPPAPPVVSAPAAGAFLPSGTVLLAGTAEPGAAVAVTVGLVSGAATASSEGDWSVTLSLLDGAHTASVVATDPVGNGSTAATRAFTVDTVAPPAPTIATPAADAFLNGGTVAFTGTAEPGSTVRVGVGVLSTTTTADPDGSFVATLTLADGEHTALVTARDAAGNLSDASARSFTVDTLAPASPLVVEPAEDALLATATVTFSGSAEPGALVAVRAGTASASGTAAADGAWSVTLAPGDGTFTASVVATDPAGNASLEATRGFTIDTTAPAAPAIVTPAAGAFLAQGSVVVVGTAEAGATVTVTVGLVTGSAVAALDGSWSVTLSLADGAHTASAVATDLADNASLAATRSFTVDTAAPAVPTITTPAAGAFLASGSVLLTGTAEAGATVAVTVGLVTASGVAALDGSWSVTLSLADGAHTASAVAADPAGNPSPAATRAFTVDTAAPAPPTLTGPAPNAQLATGAVVFTGTAEAGSTVTATAGSVSGSAVVAADGSWSVTLDLADGAQSATVVATDAAGNDSVAVTLGFGVDTAEPAVPTITSPAAGALLASGSVVFAGTAEAGATVTVTVGDVTGSAVSAGDGSWSVTLGLADGALSATAVATDAAGNASLEAALGFGIDTVAPAAPSILAPGNGAPVSPGLVEVRGTAEAGALVTVTAAGSTATASAGADGSWSLQLAIAEGTHPVAATATDAAGNVSAASEITVVARVDDGAGGGGGCGCRTGAGGGAPALLGLAGLLALAPRTRRRRAA